MNERNFGQKPQNWHRPLRDDQLTQRYLRHRYDDAESDNEREQYLAGMFDVDEYWDWMSGPYCLICGRRDCQDLYWPEAPKEDFTFYQAQQIVRDLLTPSPIAAVFEELVPGKMPEAELQIADDGTLAKTRKHEKPVEERLAEWVDGLLGAAGSSGLEKSLRLSMGGPADIDALIRGSSELSPAPQLATRIGLFSPFWIRCPSIWKPDSELTLLEHLFVEYSVPSFLESAWLQQLDSDEPMRTSLKWLCWFILIAQGGSLKRAARFFDWQASGAFQYELHKVPDGLSPAEACCYAEIFRLGGSPVDFQRVASYRAFLIDPTEKSADERFPEFWRSTVDWMIRHRDAITDDESFQILEWAMHEHTEAQRIGQTFSWKGRSSRNTVERAVAYGRQRYSPYQCFSWQGHDWDWTYEDESQRWSFVELTSTEQLAREGQALRHCVESYGGRCAAGQSAIVSLRCNDRQLLTIEIQPRSRQIVQVRGLQNRPANVREEEIVRRWISRMRQGERLGVQS